MTARKDDKRNNTLYRRTGISTVMLIGKSEFALSKLGCRTKIQDLGVYLQVRGRHIRFVQH
jgi:hypothetical protein